LIRPDVVWFGELLPEDQFSAAEGAAINCDLFFIVGTSGVVYPAASLITRAKQNGAKLVEINIEKTEISDLTDWSFFGEAGTILPQIINETGKTGRK
jgi:NAD-dependent deacetylase